ncbi:MAG: AAC(3) family N-acetyltransferase [Cyclobacteriaceae bacterium]
MGNEFSILKRDIKNMGVHAGDHLLVHASLKSIGRFENSARIVIDAFLEVLGPEGTLLMPTLSYLTVNKENPHFDQNETPSCVGALTEFFRTRRGVQRSVHPTHSVAGLGKEVDFFLADHLNDHTPCGPHSPFSKLKEKAGKVLFMGCGPKPNTSMHAIEEKVEPHYLLGAPVTYQLKLKDGQLIIKDYIRHGFKGFEQRYDRLIPLLKKEDYRKGHLLAADALLLKTSPMWEKALLKLQEDPMYFVDRVGHHP